MEDISCVGQSPDVKSEISEGTPAESQATGLLDMPDEILEKILNHLDNYQQVSKAQMACTRLKQVSANILHSAYRRLEIDLADQVAGLRVEFGKLNKNLFRDCRQLEKISDCILHLENVLSSFAIAKATIWCFVRAGVFSDYDAMLLDAVCQAREDVMNSRLSLHKTLLLELCVRKCRCRAAESIRNFTDTLTKARLSDENRARIDTLASIALLETLMCSLDSTFTLPQLARCPNGARNGTGLASLSTSITLNNCWMGIYSTAEYKEKPAEDRVQEAMQAVRELVWNGNYELHLSDWQKRKRLLTENAFERLSCYVCVSDVPIHLWSGFRLKPGGRPLSSTFVDVIRDRDYNKRNFEVIDSDDERILYYGNGSRVQGLQTLGMSRLLRRGRHVELENKVVIIPPCFTEGKLEISIGITCREALLPQFLGAIAAVSEKGLESEHSLHLEITSHKDNSWEESRRLQFICRQGAEFGKDGYEVDDNFYLDLCAKLENADKFCLCFAKHEKNDKICPKLSAKQENEDNLCVEPGTKPDGHHKSIKKKRRCAGSCTIL